MRNRTPSPPIVHLLIVAPGGRVTALVDRGPRPLAYRWKLVPTQAPLDQSLTTVTVADELAIVRVDLTSPGEGHDFHRIGPLPDGGLPSNHFELFGRNPRRYDNESWQQLGRSTAVSIDLYIQLAGWAGIPVERSHPHTSGSTSSAEPSDRAAIA